MRRLWGELSSSARMQKYRNTPPYATPPSSHPFPPTVPPSLPPSSLSQPPTSFSRGLRCPACRHAPRSSRERFCRRLSRCSGHTVAAPLDGGTPIERNAAASIVCGGDPLQAPHQRGPSLLPAPAGVLAWGRAVLSSKRAGLRGGGDGRGRARGAHACGPNAPGLTGVPLMMQRIFPAKGQDGICDEAKAESSNAAAAPGTHTALKAVLQPRRGFGAGGGLCRLAGIGRRRHAQSDKGNATK